eukprot:scaffold110018_cov69-Phaeocystis_antarctica.AAC.2
MARAQWSVASGGHTQRHTEQHCSGSTVLCTTARGSAKPLVRVPKQAAQARAASGSRARPKPADAWPVGWPVLGRERRRRGARRETCTAHASSGQTAAGLPLKGAEAKASSW